MMAQAPAPRARIIEEHQPIARSSGWWDTVAAVSQEAKSAFAEVGPYSPHAHPTPLPLAGTRIAGHWCRLRRDAASASPE